MRKASLIEHLKAIRCRSRGKTGAEVATECIDLVEKIFDVEVSCCKCGKPVQINSEKYHCQSWF